MPQTFGVAVKAIVQNPDGDILVLYKSESEDIHPNSFDLPGGRIQWGEKVEDAVKREVKEETKLNIEIVKITRSWGFTKGDLHLVGISFLTNCENENVLLSDEHSDFFWKKKEEILEGNFPDWMKEEVRLAL